MSANRVALDRGVPSGRITEVLNGRRSISADTALRPDRYLGNDPQFWLDFQSQCDIAVVESERGEEIARRGNRPTQPDWSSSEALGMWRVAMVGRRPAGPIAGAAGPAAAAPAAAGESFA